MPDIKLKKVRYVVKVYIGYKEDHPKVLNWRAHGLDCDSVIRECTQSVSFDSRQDAELARAYIEAKYKKTGTDPDKWSVEIEEEIVDSDSPDDLKKYNSKDQ